MSRRLIGTAFVTGVLALLWPTSAQAQCVNLISGYGTRKGVDSFVLDVLDSNYQAEVNAAAAAWNDCPGVGQGHAPELGGGWGPEIEINHVSGMSPVCGDTDVDASGGTITIYLNGPSTCPDTLTTLIHEFGHALGLDDTGCSGYAMSTDGDEIHEVDSAECSTVASSWMTQNEIDNGPDPLIFDLDGDGILTSDVDLDPVRFDINSDGYSEMTGWTVPDALDGLLFMDLNNNKVVDGGYELFGDTSTLPYGSAAANGFDALAVYDLPENGGNNDGQITRRDRVWAKLRLWVDVNHDAFATGPETRTLGHYKIVAIELVPTPGAGADASGNIQQLTGVFWVRGPGGALLPRQVDSFVFRTIQ